MLIATVLYVAAGLTSLGSQTLAGSVPKLSGHWVMQEDLSPNANATGSGVMAERRLPKEFTITQDARTLTVSRPTASGENKVVYALDGSDVKAGQPVAKWEGQKLVIVNKRDVDGTTIIRTASYWIEGVLLKFEVKTAESAGGTGPATSEVITTATYKKASLGGLLYLACAETWLAIRSCERSDQRRMVSPEGIEPSTNRLRGRP